MTHSSDNPPSENNNFYKNLIDNLYDGIYFVDRERVITYWNKGAERITGYDIERVLGRSCYDNLLNHVSASGVQLCLNGCPLAACMEDGVVREVEVYLHHADGHRLPVLVRASPIRDAQGAIIGAVETFSDNSGMMSVRKQIRALVRSAHQDALTEVSSRQYLENRLRSAISGASRESLSGLLFIDVDNFKSINDTHGHDVGDQVLRMVAATLRHNLRSTDAIGRWGGDEFLAILEEVGSNDALKAIAEKLRSLVETSHLECDGNELAVTISVGGTLLQPGDALETIVRRADELMYQSKRSGSNSISVE